MDRQSADLQRARSSEVAPSPSSSSRFLEKNTLLSKYREDDIDHDDLENEIEGNAFQLQHSPVRSEHGAEFLHSPFQIIENRAKQSSILQETSRPNSQQAFERVSSRSKASAIPRDSKNKRSRSRNLSITSAGPNSCTGSPKTEKHLSAPFRNITPLNLEDAGRFQGEDTPILRRAAQKDDFQFKKPLANHRRVTSVDEKVPSSFEIPSLQRGTSASSSRTTSPVRQMIANRQNAQSVSLTPAQRSEKHGGRLSSGYETGYLDAKSALDNYAFKEALGRGASASVYKAINLNTEAVVAIKQIEINTKEDIELMMTEIRLLKVLKHKNIVKYHGYVNNGQTLNIILEYCSGGSLRKLYKQRGKGLEEEEIVRYTREILAGLQYLHQQGVIHRDVKAANVLLTGDGSLKLADFGVSSRTNHKSSLVVGGSPYWMAPEVILLQGSSTKSDIWSLGATVIELFTTQPPYHDLDPMAACHAIGVEDCPALPANLSPIMKDFLMECFQKSPEIRIDAKRLLQHPWLNPDLAKRQQRIVSRKISKSDISTSATPKAEPQYDAHSHQIGHHSRAAITPKNQDLSRVLAPKLRNKKISIETKEKLVGPKSPFRESDDNDFFGDADADFVDLQFAKKSIPHARSKEEILNQFNEAEAHNEYADNDEDDGFDQMFETIGSDELKLAGLNEITDTVDPFMSLDLQDNLADPRETELISTVENLIQSLDAKNDNVAETCSQLKMILLEDGNLGKVVVRNHGLIRLSELLENENIDVVIHCATILNLVFKNCPSALGSYCTIGGITSILRYNDFKYPNKLRLQVVTFIDHLILESNATILQMFIACGGLKVLVRFVEEDMEAKPEFVSCGVNGIASILQCDLPTSRSDFCYLLKDSVDWIAVNLRYLIELDNAFANKVVSIFQSFSYSEPRVKSYITTTTLLKSIMRIHKSLEFNNRLKMLKFISSLSSVSSTLNILDASNCLPFLVQQLTEVVQTSDNNDSPFFKETANAICPTIFNLCHLNKIRQMDLVELNAVPILATLVATKFPFKDFILPILSEMVLINTRTRAALARSHVFEIFLELLINPNWQVNSLDAIKNWITLGNNTTNLIGEENVRMMIMKAFKITTNLDFLQKFLELINIDVEICHHFGQLTMIEAVFEKLTQFKNNAIIEITVLKILKKLIVDNITNKELILQVRKLSGNLVISDDRSVIVHELIKDIGYMI